MTTRGSGQGRRGDRTTRARAGRRSWWSPALGAGVGVGLLLAALAPATATADAVPKSRYGTPPCVAAGDVTAEEELLTEDVPRRLLAESRLGRLATAFDVSLCAFRTEKQARWFVQKWSALLWRAGVEDARSAAGPGQRDADDRALYWARLSMTSAVRQWAQHRDLPDTATARLVATIDRTSRGQDDVRTGRGDEPVVLLTGFDPFFLPREPRTANPSGAVALALDGTTVQGPDGPVRVETMLFPVRWRDFGDGMVEKALEPVLDGPKRPELVFTISQGRVGQFDLEAVNGAWRGGTVDNEAACHQGIAPVAEGLPTVTPQPQWTRSTLPRSAMVEAGSGPFEVLDRSLVVEVPGDTPVPPARTECPALAEDNEGTDRTDGPTAGSQARSGAGGNYLSNEVAYRATLLRDALGLGDLPVGHVHTPVLEGVDATESALSNPEFVQNRRAIIDQTTRLLEAALAASAD